MNILNAIKKTEKLTGCKIIKKNGCYFVVKNNMELSFIKNGGDSDQAICFKTRRVNDNDDLMSDYHAGTFWDNLTQAINYINN